MLKWQSFLPYSIPKEDRQHVIRNVRTFLDGALVGNVEVEAVGSDGIQITSSTTDTDLSFVVTASQLQRTPCIMLVARRGTEPPAKKILELSVVGGENGTAVLGLQGATTGGGITGNTGEATGNTGEATGNARVDYTRQFQTLLDHITSERRKLNNYIHEEFEKINNKLDALQTDLKELKK